ncbi:MAG: CpcT/CpeT family chromophore lyase [Gammaproteobacteria bacterium]|nr:CpcT/CpeT family chromophore lyase [Gammaproteobacteria bacterium]MYA35677.1 hypothetical protein [Gammaproteobacteria bacterium]MYH85020.1 hypothetical protein [Gammaproteobacteria bacterium]MYK05593.1 hypothetical protein [Gammaproteobacteria bacterium]
MNLTLAAPVYRSVTSFLFGALSSWLAWQATAAEGKPTLDRIIDRLEGSYSNEAQVAAGELDAENNLLFPVFKQVDIPAFGTHVVYLQWPIDSPDGRLQRQRLWTFHKDAESDAIHMNFFTLREPERWLDAHIDPDKVRDMKPEDTIGYPDTCLLPVTWENENIRASIPSTCEIVSQATRTTMTLKANITITPDRITYQEGGVRSDGSIVFQVPPKGRYVFERIRD